MATELKIRFKFSCRIFAPCSIRVKYTVAKRQHSPKLVFSCYMCFPGNINLLVLSQFRNPTAGGVKHLENKKIHLLVGRLSGLQQTAQPS